LEDDVADFSHVDDDGKLKMVDVGAKPDQARRAIAKGRIIVGADVVRMIKDNTMKKGDVLTCARIAGIQGAKRTSELIPLCHPLPVDWLDVRTELGEDDVIVTAEARYTGKTGIEMEALTGVAVALLTVYDMCKAVRKDMVMTDIHLVSKEKSDV
jgi:cyclic pyranopterin phosphate synthase